MNTDIKIEVKVKTHDSISILYIRNDGILIAVIEDTELI